MSDKKVGVVLSGCGVFDGSEIHETVITLLALDRAGAEIVCMAPDGNQLHVIDHTKTEPAEGENRDIFIESARIARGELKNIKEIKANNLDALVFPGGFGAAKNLCTFAVAGPDCAVNAEVERLIKEMHAAKKAMAFMCIAPAIAAKVLGEHSPVVTIGTDEQTAQAIEKMGGKHQNCKVDEIAIDDQNKLVTTPAYMLGPSISDVAAGIEKCIAKLMEMA